MRSRYIFVIVSSCFFLSCHNNKAEKNNRKEIAIEGRFVKIEKKEPQFYDLYLQLTNDSIVVFKTLMPIGEFEIERLKKQGNNIKLIYIEYKNPYTNTIDKEVRFCIPLYEMEKQASP